MTYFGFCWSIDIDGVPPLKGLQCARSILGPQALIRTGQDTSVLFADPDLAKTDWTKFDRTYANCLDAGIHFYCNVGNLPAHVTGGVPAYQTQIGGAGAQFLVNHGIAAERLPAIYEAATNPTIGGSDVSALTPQQKSVFAALGPLPPNIDPFWLTDRFLEGYRDEQAHTWASDDPARNGGGGPWHVWGERGHEAADRISAPRPWLLDWSKIPPANLAKVKEMARLIGARYRNARFHGFGNEFGFVGFNIDMRHDGANMPGGPDTVKERLAPLLNAYYQGLWEVTAATTAGFEHDGTGIMNRCDEHVLAEPQIITYHPYPRGGKSPIEMCRTEWWPAIDAILAKEASESVRGEGIGEIGGDPMELVRFTADVLRERPQTKMIVFLTPNYFIDGFTTDNPQPNAAGRALSALLREVNPRRRAVSK